MTRAIENWEDRFWSYVSISPGCWLWTGKLTRKGYGQFWLHGKTQSAHRVSYTLSHGGLESSLFVCHRCDNPRCVRPEHLFAGTHDENMADMVAKRRQAKGVANGRSKLSHEQVIEIVALLDAGWSEPRVARRFRVAPSLIHRIKVGKSWSHVTGRVA